MPNDRTLIETELRKLSKGEKTLQPSRLLNRIATKTGLSVIAVESGLAEMVQEGLLEGVSTTGRPVKMVRWLGESLVESDELAMTIRDHFTAHGIEAPDNECLGLSKAMSGLDLADVKRLLDGLLALQGVTDDVMFASSRHLLGSAKALKGLSVANRVLPSLPTHNNGEMFVITAGPRLPEAIVLIENLRSFSAFADSRHTERILGVASYGYGLTMQNFAQQLYAGKVTACPCRGEKPNLKALIASKPVFLWGDLDQEGLRIFENMRREIPGLALSAAYVDLEKRANNPNHSHPYHRLFDKAGQRPARGDTAEVIHLSAVCRDRAVDQESLGSNLAMIDFTKPYRIP